MTKEEAVAKLNALPKEMWGTYGTEAHSKYDGGKSVADKKSLEEAKAKRAAEKAEKAKKEEEKQRNKDMQQAAQKRRYEQRKLEEQKRLEQQQENARKRDALAKEEAEALRKKQVAEARSGPQAGLLKEAQDQKAALQAKEQAEAQEAQMQQVAAGAAEKEPMFAFGNLRSLPTFYETFDAMRDKRLFAPYLQGSEDLQAQLEEVKSQYAEAEADLEEYKRSNPIPRVAAEGGFGSSQLDRNSEEARTVSEKEKGLDTIQTLMDNIESSIITNKNIQIIDALPKEIRDGMEFLALRDISGGSANHPKIQREAAKTEQALLDRGFSKEEIFGLAESYSRVINARNARNVESGARAEVDDGFFSGLWANAKALGANAIGGPAGTAEALSATLRGLLGKSQYPTADPNAAGYLFGDYAGTVRGETSNSIQETLPGAVGDAVDTLYKGTTGAADNLVRIALSGGSSVVNLGLSSTNAFQNSYRDATLRGASPEQATLMGVADASIEYLTEKLPLEKLMDSKTTVDGWASWLKNASAQGLIEVGEEEVGFIANLMTDAAIMGDKSELSTTINDMIAGGMTRKEAEREAYKQLAHQALETATTSYISGAGMSAGYTLPNAIHGSPLATPPAAQQPLSPPEEATGAQPQQPQEQTPLPGSEPISGADIMDAAIRGEDAGPAASAEEAIVSAMGSVLDGGIPSNNMARRILQNQDAVDFLRETVGLELPGTASGNREAVKQAIFRLVADDLTQENGSITLDSQNKQSYDNLTEQHTGGENYGRGNDNGGVQRNEEVNFEEQTPRSQENGGRYQEPSYHEGVLQARGSGSTIFSSDSEGRSVSQKQADALEGTSVVDSNGAPIALYHSTDNTEFDVFEKGDVGFHFGTSEQATKRSTDKKNVSGRTFRVYLNVKNPVKADLDIMGWRSNGAAIYLESRGILTEAETNEITALSSKGTEYNSPASVRLREILESKGYDGISYPNGFEGKGDSYIAFHDSQIIRSEITSFGPQDADNESRTPTDARNQLPKEGVGGAVQPRAASQNTVGAAQQNFSGVAAYEDLLSDGNVQRERPGDVRNVEVPKVDGQGRKVSEFVGNAMGSAITPDSFTTTIEKLTADGALSHDVMANKKALQDAARRIGNSGIDVAIGRIQATAESGKTSAHDVAEATLLYNYLVNDTASAKSQEKAADVFVSLSQLATNSGQSLQLFSMFRSLTPDGKVRAIKTEIDRYTKRAVKRGLVKKNFEPVINDDILDMYRKACVEAEKATTPKQVEAANKKMAKVQSAIYKNAAAQMPVTFKAKWDAWRYMSMLGNVKTNVRNAFGNAFMMPYTEAKRVIGAAVERVFIQDKSQRTKAVIGFGEGDRQLMSWAKADQGNDAVKDALQYTGKLGDDATFSKMQDNVKIFDNKMLERMRKLTSDVPGAFDMIFKNVEYSRALAGYIKAQGYSYDDIQGGMVSEAVLNRARSYAVNEAMKATFNDANALSDFISNLRFTEDNPVGKIANAMCEGILPFRRTPANIVKRSVEYSPLELLEVTFSDIRKVRSGEMSASTMIDHIASSVTGSAAMLLGVALANAGILRGSDLDEDEKRQGHQEYSVEFTFRGKPISYKIDWAAPANLPLFVGANLQKALSEQGADTSLSNFTKVIYALQNTFEPMLELSCLSSLNDLISSARYADEGSEAFAFAATAATSYLTQGIPALTRQASQAWHENKQETFANSEDPFLRGLQRTAGNIPLIGEPFRQDAVNEWGETESQGNLALRVFNAFINPGSTKTIQSGPLEDEVVRLGQVQPDSVSPDPAQKSISYTDADGNRVSNHRLTEEEYRTMETVQGQTAKTMLDGIIGTEDYKNLPDDLKAKVFDKVYDYAREKARSEALEGYPAPDIGTPEEFAETVVRDSLVGASKLSEADYDAAVKAGFTLEQMQNVSKVKKEFSGYFSDLTDGWKNGDQGMSTAALDDAYGDFTLLPYDQQKFITDRLSGREEAFFEAKKAQIPSQTFVGLYKEYCDIGKREDLTSAQKAREWSHALEKARQSGKLNYMSTEVMRKELTYQSGFTADDGKYGGMVDAGASPDGAKLVADLMDSIVGTGNIDKKTGKPSITADDRYQAIATSSLGESDKDIAMKAYMDDYDPTSKNPDTTELKYDYLRKEIGLTPEQYAIVRAAYGRAGTKDRIQRTAVRNALNNAPHSEKVFRILDGKEKKLLIELYG